MTETLNIIDMQTTGKDPRYPIGLYVEQPYSEIQKIQWMNDIKYLPSLIEIEIQTFDEAQLETPYREGGWTVKQLVHHVADSHMNAMIRFKLGLTEDNPVIKPYDEKAWSLLPDSKTIPVNVSVTLLHALHLRWHALLSGINTDQFERTVFHPERKQNISLWKLLGLYAWHGKHHLAHITTLKENKNWH